MQKKKFGTAVIWMVCLLGMVAVVWSRPPMGRSKVQDHPPLALAAPEPLETTFPGPVSVPMSPVNPPLTPEPAATEEISPAVLPAQIWIREIAPFQISLTLEGNRLLATCEGPVDGRKMECRISADYQVTKDSILYGVITSAEISLDSDDPEERHEADATARLFFDQPFSCRYRFDENTLTIKDCKIGQFAKNANGLDALPNCVIGCYHQAPPQTQR